MYEENHDEDTVAMTEESPSDIDRDGMYNHSHKFALSSGFYRHKGSELDFLYLILLKSSRYLYRRQQANEAMN